MPTKNDVTSFKYLYLTTTGRITERPREIELWFVESKGKLYVLAEHFRKAHWVKNIEHNPRVGVRIGDREFRATARILDEQRDRAAWHNARQLASEKYGWGDGLPVEIIRDA